MFFVECDKERILVLVDRKQQVFELKLPFLKNVLTEENSDRIAEISDKGYHEMQFNKWNGAFSFGSHQWDDCQMLDPDSRQPLFK